MTIRGFPGGQLPGSLGRLQRVQYLAPCAVWHSRYSLIDQLAALEKFCLPELARVRLSLQFLERFVLKYAAIGPISVYLPEAVETNDQFRAEFPQWDMDLIYSKTGVGSRHVAAPNECSSDLGVKAALKLFQEHSIDPASIDFVLLCTQTPDYPLPTTACLLQDRLSLRKSVGAIDFNQGCSGYVYGLSMAEGLIRSGAANRVLFITAETYSKYISRDDRSLRTIFGDGATATLLYGVSDPALSSFVFGTDGSGADLLMVNKGGSRPEEDAHKPKKRHRWASSLYMDGPALVDFAVTNIPKLIGEILEREKLHKDQVDYFLFHQATRHMLEKLRNVTHLTEERSPMFLESVGNTVSSTIPIVIHEMRAGGQIKANHRSMLIGFGVGLSWAGCMWRETFSGKLA